MTLRLHNRRLLGTGLNTSSSSSSSSTSPPDSNKSSSHIKSVNSDFVVILAALLCALICVLGLISVARCGWIRRISTRLTGNLVPSRPPANKALKKKVLKSLPKLNYSSQLEAGKKLSDCAICLTEFATGDELRVLPQCGHGFHVGCIDTWLGSHSSCPSCRQILVAAPPSCEKCGEMPPPPASSLLVAEPEALAGSRSTQQRGDYADRFLP